MPVKRAAHKKSGYGKKPDTCIISSPLTRKPEKTQASSSHVHSAIVLSAHKQSAPCNPRLPLSTEIPESYNESFIRALPKDPLWLYVYWEFTDDISRAIKKKTDRSRWVLRLTEMPRIVGNTGRMFDIEIDPKAKSWYIKMPESSRNFVIEFGKISNGGAFISLIKSSQINSPQLEQGSDQTDRKWLSPLTPEQNRYGGLISEREQSLPTDVADSRPDDRGAADSQTAGPQTIIPISQDTPQTTIFPARSRRLITAQPATQTIASGSTVVFSIMAGSASAPTYQWFLNNSAIAGATSSILVVPNAAAANAGTYTCTIANSQGSVTSLPAMLNVTTTSDPGRLVNLSCRAQVGAGGNILIAGFAVGGLGTSGSEALLVRGSGPALTAFGVSGTLPDPQLQLFSGGKVLGTNNGWDGNPAVASAATSVGAFAWSNLTSHDSALLENLPTGPYTAQIAGQSGDSGVALVEVYDATPPGAYTPTSPRLVNISTRVQVGSGGGSLIAGFVIGGSTSRTVLVRASGPALASFGVPDVLPDPKLGLYSGSTELAVNSGWGGNTAIASTFAAVGAFAWNSPSSLDSAILVTLPPGPYTAQVSGASGDVGVALVEVYEVP